MQIKKNKSLIKNDCDSKFYYANQLTSKQSLWHSILQEQNQKYHLRNEEYILSFHGLQSIVK